MASAGREEEGTRGAVSTGEAGVGPQGCRVIVEENHDLPIARLSLTLLTGFQVAAHDKR